MHSSSPLQKIRVFCRGHIVATVRWSVQPVVPVVAPKPVVS